MDETVRATIHDDTRSPGELGAALRLLRLEGQVREACVAALTARLRTALRALDEGSIDSARYLIETTIRDIGGAV